MSLKGEYELFFWTFSDTFYINILKKCPEKKFVFFYYFVKFTFHFLSFTIKLKTKSVTKMSKMYNYKNTESLCFIPETNMVNQLSFNKNKIR